MAEILLEDRPAASASPRTSLVKSKGGGALPIYSVTPFTMLDFPDKTACIIWFSGCNMRCGYCHNPQIVKGKGKGTVKDVMTFLERRQGLLDGVVLSGGEASLYPGLPHFIGKVKELGYAVKLDTNGTRPERVKDFLERGWLDYVALDYKAPPEKFKKVTGIGRFTAFERTLQMLCTQSAIPFEVRTTVHTDLLDENDIAAIIHDLGHKNYQGTFYVQNFCADNDRPTLGFMPDQKRILRIDQLPRPQGFTLAFRNFP